MIHLYLADVGDGLAATIYTPFGRPIQIDCGSQQASGRQSFEVFRRIRPKALFLSHFHTDHYNGLFHASPHDSFDIGNVFFPRLPIFPERTKLFECFFAMASRVMGDLNGSPEADFISVVQRFNSRSFRYRSLSLGDVVTVEGSHFEVLWPPRVLEETRTLRVIERAINDFDEAKASDSELRRLYDVIGESGKVRPYLIDGEVGESAPDSADDFRATRASLYSRDLPEIVVRANRSLRNAANHISLALKEDNRLLFLGDLERHQIRQVVSQLVERQHTSFLVTITPHHGTPWHDTLRELRSIWAVSSLGDQLIGNFRAEFKAFADFSLTTYTNGDINVPSRHHTSLDIAPYWYRWWQPRF